MYATINQPPLSKVMNKKLLACLAVLTLCLPLLAQQDTNAPAATNAAPPAASYDPAGATTGTIGDASGAAGSYSYPTFQVTEPAALSAEDMKDTNKVATYNDAKKAFDDYNAQAKAEPLAVKLADAVGHNRISVNFVWTLVTGFLVMFMQAGFALVETGLCRHKNAAHTMTMNMMIYPLGMIGFYVCGFAFMFGGVGTPGAGTLGTCSSLTHEFTINLFGKPFGLLGTHGFFLTGDTYDAGLFCLFLFQMVFMDTTATIPTGAAAERWKFSAFMLYGCFIGTVMYPVFGNWVWGGGWLSQLGVNFGLGHGHVDFAGSSVVHMVGGVAALPGAIVIGPRIGKYGKDGTVNTIPGHNIPMALLGCFILAFGWFGFNPGSTLAGTDLRISVVAVNTMLASASGAVIAALYMKLKTDKWDPGMMANGMLAGLVAITAPCAFVNATSAVLIGVIAGVLVIVAALFVEHKLKIDDPVGAFAVHGVNGFWGVLSLGLFADGTYGDGWNGVAGPVKGLFYGDSSQFIAELIGGSVCFVFVFSVMYAFFKI